MESDALTFEVEMQVEMLQNQLKSRLQQAQDLNDLQLETFDFGLKIEESSAHLKQTSISTKWMWFYEYLKYVLLAVGLGIILILIFLKLFIK